MGPGRTERGERYVAKARYELGSLAARGVTMVGNAFSSVLLLKGKQSEADRDGGLLTGADGGALRAALQALGYDIDVTVLLPALELREGVDGYCDGYAATDAGVPLDVRQGDIVSEKGKWYVSLNFLKVAMHAETTWDEDENTMILRIREKDQILTAD